MDDDILRDAAFSAGSRPTDNSDEVIRRALHAVRVHLGLQVAYVSKFVDNNAVFCAVDAPGLEHLIKPGDERSLDDIYCRHILEGRLPELMPDTAAVPLAASMPITQAASIGAHVSVPILLRDGKPYGMFCCLGAADQSLNARDLQTMKAFAEIVSFEINKKIDHARVMAEKRARIEDAIASNALSAVYQPIWDVEAGHVVGFEALARFAPLPYRSPDKWFEEAFEVGMGPALEIAAIRVALSALPQLPATAYLSLNASAHAITHPDFAPLFHNLALEQIVVEITEHAVIGNYTDLLEALRPLRARGLRLAVDDAGAGYSSFRHILNLEPDLIKLDIGMTRDVDIDPARKALARALVEFAAETGSAIIAEGVERSSELDTLRTIGTQMVQGYLLGKPMPLDAALDMLSCPPPVAHEDKRTAA